MKENLATTTKLTSFQENFHSLIKMEYNLDSKDLHLLHALSENEKVFKKSFY
jgi:hypothetical protein